MPQIWVTYEELAALFACTEPDARKLANKQQLERATGRDGEARVQLCSIGMAMFAERLRRPNASLERVLEQNYARYAQMKESLTKWRSYYPWIG
jgi:hypothetical protein